MYNAAFQSLIAKGILTCPSPRKSIFSYLRTFSVIVGESLVFYESFFFNYYCNFKWHVVYSCTFLDNIGRHVFFTLHKKGVPALCSCLWLFFCTSNEVIGNMSFQSITRYGHETSVDNICPGYTKKISKILSVILWKILRRKLCKNVKVMKGKHL